MAHFELQVCQNGYWRRLETFEDRDAAMSASIKSEHSQRYSGVKVVREVYDDLAIETPRPEERRV